MDDNRDNQTVFVGTKSVPEYATSVSLIAQEHQKVFIVARGKFISKAVDVSEMALKRILQGWEKEVIRTDSEEFQNDKKRMIRVSTIEIVLTKESENESERNL